MDILKTSGQHEAFDLDKLRRSLMNAGASDVVANEVAQSLALEVQELVRRND